MKKIKKGHGSARGREQTEATAGKLPVPRKKNIPTRCSVLSARQAQAALSTQPGPFSPRTAVCSNQRITGRSDQTGSGSERAAVGVEAPVGGIAL